LDLAEISLAKTIFNSQQSQSFELTLQD
jgi:hypothetical protein